MAAPLKHTSEQYQSVLEKIEEAVALLRESRARFDQLEPSIATRVIDDAINAAIGEALNPALMLRELRRQAYAEESAAVDRLRTGGR
jgi:hypothetical protein